MNGVGELFISILFVCAACCFGWRSKTNKSRWDIVQDNLLLVFYIGMSGLFLTLAVLKAAGITPQ